MFDFLPAFPLNMLGLFVSSFLAATLLPGGSEVVLFAVVRGHPDQALLALWLATLGNTLGGMSTYCAGRLIQSRPLPKQVEWVRRRGSVMLLLSWVPVIGDGLCLAAGWLRVHWAMCLVWMGLGKAARYALVIGVESLM